MKRSLLVAAFALVASACSTQNNASETNGFPGSPVLTPRLNLSCVEKQTLVDAPGYEHEMSIRQAIGSASVQRREISMAGQGEWMPFDHAFLVTSDVSDEGRETLYLAENVNKDIDWSKEDGCFKLVPQQTYRISQDAEGNWSGYAQLIGNILVDPAAVCNVPHLAQPRQYEIACSYK